MSKRPADLEPTLLWSRWEGKNSWGASAVLNPDRHEEDCRVFWGSHGCDRPRGHDGPHWCSCCDCDDHPADDACVGGPPYYGPATHFFGEDAADTTEAG